MLAVFGPKACPEADNISVDLGDMQPRLEISGSTFCEKELKCFLLINSIPQQVFKRKAENRARKPYFCGCVHRWRGVPFWVALIKVYIRIRNKFLSLAWFAAPRYFTVTPLRGCVGRRVG